MTAVIILLRTFKTRELSLQKYELYFQRLKNLLNFLPLFPPLFAISKTPIKFRQKHRLKLVENTDWHLKGAHKNAISKPYS